MASKRMVANVVEAPVMAKIVKRAPRPKQERPQLAGTYRVIHGTLTVPRPRSEWTFPDGTENLHEPKTELAREGDEVELGNEDAFLLLGMDIPDSAESPRALRAVVEALDAKPSRVGKVSPQPGADRRRNDAGRAAHTEYVD